MVDQISLPEIRYMPLPREGKEIISLGIYDAKPSLDELYQPVKLEAWVSAHLLELSKADAWLSAEDAHVPTFVLTSGLLAPYYVDLRVIPSHPNIFNSMINQAVSYVDMTVGIRNVEFVASSEAAGIPYGAVAAFIMKKPFDWIRKQPKEIGTKKTAEGYIRPGSRGIGIDDLLTTTKTLQTLINGVNEEKGYLMAVYELFNRRQYDAQTAELLGPKLFELLNIFEHVDIGQRKGRISQKMANAVRQYHRNQAGYAYGVINANQEFFRKHPKVLEIRGAYEKLFAEAKEEKAKEEAKKVVDLLVELSPMEVKAKQPEPKHGN